MKINELFSKDEFEIETTKATNLLIDFFELNNIHKATAFIACQKIVVLIMREQGIDDEVIVGIVEQIGTAFKYPNGKQNEK